MPNRKSDITDEPLIDTTFALPLRSKRLERLQKKRHQKAHSSKQHATLWDLPSEILLDILGLLPPSSIFTLSQASKSLHAFIQSNSTTIATSIINLRYPILARCFPLPILLQNVPEEAHPALLDEERQIKHLNIHKKPYQHIQPPNPQLVCTCLTCILAWNNLCVIIDFAFWQGHLERGDPIPMIPRGRTPKWNTKLISRHACKVLAALENPIFYARILQEHLNSTITSIKRHSANTGNKRRRFLLKEEDENGGTDGFLEGKGPASLDFPFHRDNYYMLEAYLPNRGWSEERGRWWYLPREQHERDVEFVVAWMGRRDEAARVKRGTEKGENEVVEERARIDVADGINGSQEQENERIRIAVANGGREGQEHNENERTRVVVVDAVVETEK
jgi:hypothetical protein